MDFVEDSLDLDSQVQHHNQGVVAVGSSHPEMVRIENFHEGLNKAPKTWDDRIQMSLDFGIRIVEIAMVGDTLVFQVEVKWLGMMVEQYLLLRES